MVAVRGMAPLAPPITTVNRRSFSAECPVPRHPARVIRCILETVPEARLTSFSITMGLVQFIPSARLIDGVGWGFIIIIITIIINCKWVYTGGFYPVAVCYNARHDNAINTIQCNKNSTIQ